MKKTKIVKIQKKFCLGLLSKMEDKSFMLDRVEWRLYNKEVVLPFYASTTRGPFFTMKPSFIVQIESLKSEINNIIRREILSCGIFTLGYRFDKVLGVNGINDSIPGHNCKEIIGNYYWQIFDENDLTWMIDWYVKYLELGGWEFINKLKSHEKIYDFYKNIYMNYLNDSPDLDLFQRSFSLNSDAHTTMLYLGLKYGFPEIEEVIELTLEHEKGTLIHERTIKLKRYFAS